MVAIKIEPYEDYQLKIYAYTTPGVTYHEGWLKIGCTEQNVEARLNQQMNTPDIIYKLEWAHEAPFDDKANKYFRDTDFHRYLKARGVEQKQNREWFAIDAAAAEKLFYEFSKDKAVRKKISGTAKTYVLREEQRRAVDLTVDYYRSGKAPREFLWNAKPRFGKTLAAYDFVMKLGAEKVLIVTNRPSIANSWHVDFKDFVEGKSAYKFVSTTDSLKNTLSHEDYLREFKGSPMIAFISLQDLKGAKIFGGKLDKLGWVKDSAWDLLIIDESHEGVDTEKTAAAFENIRRQFTLYLSGTPFKAIANENFGADQIFNWSYEDEQAAKANWTPAVENDYVDNPYEGLPRMNLFSYQLSQMIVDKIIGDETVDYAFDLNEFFRTEKGKFVHVKAVKIFLDTLTTLEKYPFASADFRAKLKHTFWLLNRVDSAKALAGLLKEHKVFKDYKVIVAAGAEESEDGLRKSFDKVKAAIANNDKTITLSVGQLTTGVTIPEWTGILMLSGIKSATEYIQAAFRVQNPCSFKDGDKISRKTNCYVFDFDPVRTLKIYDEFANNLKTGGVRSNNIGALLNFFPVLAEDTRGKMIQLDAERIISLPQAIAANRDAAKCHKVVKNQFMDNNLFNIDHVFASPAILDVINKLKTEKTPDKKPPTVKVNPDGVNPFKPSRRDKGSKDGGSGDTADEKPATEIELREKLRNFARAIPSFLMVYGDDGLTLANFETYAADDIFLEIIGVSKADFQILRDAFNEPVFNAAVKEFLRLKAELADYFSGEHGKDIFDYIPPQKTSQIFTPRHVVQQMLNALEAENAGIFDNPNQKFLDPYMKSGMYIAEIVKRLFQSAALKKIFPNDKRRLRHILENQVYGFAPSRIIYQIAAEYIFGAKDSAGISRRNFFCKDLTEIIQAGCLADFFRENFTARVIVLNNERVKKFAEVFTPPLMVEFMLDSLPQEFFGDLDLKFLEPAAGNGAFLVPILKRKLDHAKNFDEMLRALKSIYAIEIQPDNVKAARRAMEKAFIGRCENISETDIARVREILEANIIKGDTRKFLEEYGVTLVMAEKTFDKFEAALHDLKDVIVIGNPPYQLDTKGDNKTFAAPVYHEFLDGFWKLSDRVMMIHPARFLFNAGATPKDFNRRALDNEHLKVIRYEPDSSKVFKNTDIKGGVAVTYKDSNEKFGKIGTFIPFPPLKSAHDKIVARKDFKPLSSIMRGTEIYTFTDEMHADNPTAIARLSKGHAYSIGTNIFDNLSEIFFEDEPNDGHEYIRLQGRENNSRACKYIRRAYVRYIPELDTYKVFIPKSYGAGIFGENGPTMLVGLPLVGCTQTFITLGAFENRTEADSAMKYVMTKFARALLGILKVTQHNPPETWSKVPLQDFSAASDIDWSRSVKDIDRQLYRKYELSVEEILFIETNVKGME